MPNVTAPAPQVGISAKRNTCYLAVLTFASWSCVKFKLHWTTYKHTQSSLEIGKHPQQLWNYNYFFFLSYLTFFSIELDKIGRMIQTIEKLNWRD